MNVKLFSKEGVVESNSVTTIVLEVNGNEYLLTDVTHPEDFTIVVKGKKLLKNTKSPFETSISQSNEE